MKWWYISARDILCCYASTPNKTIPCQMATHDGKPSASLLPWVKQVHEYMMILGLGLPK